jgi:hypothetical protein
MDLGPRLIVLIIQYSHQMAVAKPPIQQFQLNNATPTNTQVAHSPLPAVRAAPLVLVPEPPEAAPEPTTMTPVVAFPSVTTGTFPTVYAEALAKPRYCGMPRDGAGVEKR